MQFMIAGSESYLWGCFFDNMVIQTISLPKTTGRATVYYNAEKLLEQFHHKRLWFT